MKKTFNLDDKEYAIISPSPKLRQESQIEHSRTFGMLLKCDGILTRIELDRLIKNKKIWEDEKTEEYIKLNNEIAEGLVRLEQKNMRLSEAKDLAIDIVDKRTRLAELNIEYGRYDEMTADAKAEEAARDYLIANCLVDNETGEKIYKTLDEYLENKETALASMAMIAFLQMEYGSAEDIIKNNPENQFLIKYKFVNDDLRFINKEGKLVDRDGNPIEEIINEEDEVLEPGVFLDDDGNPIEEPA